ncbi:polycomb group RING finger protein 6 isoform X3 [Corythoichthys intestinalis]|uniref:polycomb group RING finger protein 6 isoform X3 n=1 Tax=Corythoichthys intestinalis TaxID=161448 RepID=UPI0025A61985|nr:polycomb group RING finger protein 6 isoform X3 [Corythoichthys intestinalis]
MATNELIDVCKSCIVKHFYNSNKCPTCTVVVHETQPLYHIRPDRQLQDIVYKMIPFLEEAERNRMVNFYKKRGSAIPKPVCASAPSGHKKQKKESMHQCMLSIPPELDVSLLLDFVGAEEGIKSYKLAQHLKARRSSRSELLTKSGRSLMRCSGWNNNEMPLERPYVRVSSDATVRHVELFIRKKMELSPTCQVDVVCGDQLLDQYQSLKDVQRTVGSEALEDGLLVLHFGLVLSCLS